MRFELDCQSAGIELSEPEKVSSLGKLACPTVPSPAKIVLDATCIARGNVAAVDGTPHFIAIETIKGADVEQKSYRLTEPVSTLKLDNTGATSFRADEPALFLGDVDFAQELMSLRWQTASLWPPRPEFQTFPSAQFDTCRSFVQTVLNYEKLASKDLIELSTLLIQDVDGSNVYAALDWTDVSFRSHTGEKERELGKLVPWAMYSKTVQKQNDRYVDQLIVSMFPLLPPTVAIPHLLRIAGKENAPAAARSRVEAMLRAHGFTNGKKLPVEELKRIFDVHRMNFQMDDESTARTMTDSASEAVRDSAETLLSEIRRTAE